MHGKEGTEAEVKVETFSTRGSPQTLRWLCLGAPGWALRADVGSALPPANASFKCRLQMRLHARVHGGARGEAGTEAGSLAAGGSTARHGTLLLGQGWLLQTTCRGLHAGVGSLPCCSGRSASRACGAEVSFSPGAGQREGCRINSEDVAFLAPFRVAVRSH